MARDIVLRLKKYSNGNYTVIGPAPAPVIRLKNKYRWQVLLKVHGQKDQSRKKVRALLKSALEQPVFSKKESQTVSIDVDPMDMM